MNLHKFQYNGLDPEGVVSRYTNLEDVEKDVKFLAEKTAVGEKRDELPNDIGRFEVVFLPGLNDLRRGVEVCL